MESLPEIFKIIEAAKKIKSSASGDYAKTNMPNIKIYFSEDSENREIEVIESQGHRSDVLVAIDNKIYHPIFITPWRQIVDMKNTFSNNSKENYILQNNVIIMENIDKKSVINRILELIKTTYFSYCSSYNVKMLEESVFDEVDEYVQVYPDRKDCSEKDILMNFNL